MTATAAEPPASGYEAAPGLGGAAARASRPRPDAGRRIVLATRNRHKAEELRAILAPLLPGVAPGRILDAGGFDIPEPVEDAVTFAGNSLIKARQLAEATGLVALADDSGLAVDVLGGAPGVFSARWCGGGLCFDVTRTGRLLPSAADSADPQPQLWLASSWMPFLRWVGAGDGCIRPGEIQSQLCRLRPR